MPRPLWTGAVSVGLVTIPIKIISATAGHGDRSPTWPGCPCRPSAEVCSYPRPMTENEIKLKAIAALTALRSGVGTDYVSDLLGEVVPEHFVVSAAAGPREVGLSVLSQLSQPLSALITGFVLAFQAVADAYDETVPATPTEEILQALALELARESD